MKKTSAAQERLFQNAVLIAARRLVFQELRLLYPCPALREVVCIHNGQGLPEGDRYATGQYVVYAAGGAVGKHSSCLTSSPFVVIGRKGSAGKSTFGPDGGWVIDTAYYAQPLNDNLSAEFLYHAIASLDFADDIITTAIPGINRTAIYRHRIPVPPLSVQHECVSFFAAAEAKAKALPTLSGTLVKIARIVARIEELSAKVEGCRRLRREATEEIELLTTTALKAVFASHTKDAGWDARPLSQAAKIARGKFAHRPRNEPRFYGGSIPFIQIGDISNSRRHIRRYSQTLNEDGLNISRMFPAGTVVIAITGATIGATGILTFDSCFPDSIVGLEPRSDIAIPEYLYWSLEHAKKIALDEARQTTQPNINLQNLERIRIPIPSIVEQRRLATQLDELWKKVDDIKFFQIQSEHELDLLMPSILSKAFAGKL